MDIPFSLSPSKETPLGYYSISKFANILFTKHLSRLLLGSNVVTYAVHPGIIPTTIYDTSYLGTALTVLFRRFLPTARDGTITTLIAALGKEFENEELSGAYIAQGRVWKESKSAGDEEETRRLWDWSMDVCGLKY